VKNHHLIDQKTENISENHHLIDQKTDNNISEKPSFN
jgi:hypothetical protein